MKYDYTTNSHYLTYTFSVWKLGRMYFLNLGVKGVKFTTWGNACWQNQVVLVQSVWLLGFLNQFTLFYSAHWELESFDNEVIKIMAFLGKGKICASFHGFHFFSASPWSTVSLQSSSDRALIWVPLESGFFLSLVKGRASWHFSFPDTTPSYNQVPNGFHISCIRTLIGLILSPSQLGPKITLGSLARTSSTKKAILRLENTGSKSAAKSSKATVTWKPKVEGGRSSTATPSQTTQTSCRARMPWRPAQAGTPMEMSRRRPRPPKVKPTTTPWTTPCGRSLGNNSWSSPISTTGSLVPRQEGVWRNGGRGLSTVAWSKTSPPPAQTTLQIQWHSMSIP